MHDPFVSTALSLDSWLGRLGQLEVDKVVASLFVVLLLVVVIGVCAFACDRLQNGSREE